MVMYRKVGLVLLMLLIGIYLGRQSMVYFKGFSVRGMLAPSKVPEKPVVKKHHYYTGKYTESIRMQNMYSGHYDIVMLGDSHTAGVNWQELISNYKIANRGVEGDVSEGGINRLNMVLNCKPSICFVDFGANDIYYAVPLDTILYNLRLIIDTLKTHNVTPIVNTVSYMAYWKQSADSFNTLIETYNDKLVSMIDTMPDVHLLDLCQLLADEQGYLDNSFALPDGLHFNSKAYKLWGDEVKKSIALRMR